MEMLSLQMLNENSNAENIHLICKLLESNPELAAEIEEEMDTKSSFDVPDVAATDEYKKINRSKTNKRV